MKNTPSSIKALWRTEHWVSVFLISLLFTLGCEKPTLEDETAFDQGSAFAITADSFRIITKTVIPEPVTGSDLSVSPLGVMQDPVFGQTVAAFYTQVRLPNNNISFHPSATVDSVILSFDYSSTYGSLDQSVDLAVFEMIEVFNLSTQYLIDKSFAVDPVALGTVTGKVHEFTDSITLDNGSKIPPQLRIRLDNQLGNRILAESGTSNLENNENFVQFFNGLYVTPTNTSSGDGVVFLDLESTVSKLTIHYTDTTVNTLELLIDNQAASVNHYQHDYNTAVFSGQINDTTDQSNLYVQSLGGIVAEVMIDDLETLPNDIAVNKAELTFTIVDDNTQSDSTYGPPAKLVLFRVDDDGDLFLLDDLVLESEELFGGEIQTNLIGGTNVLQYSFNISRYVQDILTGDLDNNGLQLFVSQSSATGGRVILGGGKHGDFPVKLALTYTKI